MLHSTVKKAIESWHGRDEGVYVSVDGQYGSTGKGVLNGALAEAIGDRFAAVTSNAGPNSGHTNFIENKKVILKQLPTFAVTVENLLKTPIDTYLNGGAIINPDTLWDEIVEWGDRHRVNVSPNAAVITPDRQEEDKANVKGIASTGQGVGPAIIAKLNRTPQGVMGGVNDPCGFNEGVLRLTHKDIEFDSYFVEVSQGYSLGINSGFYPHVTSRECTVSQAMADAGFPPDFCRGVAMSVRTYPIRVGSTENSSGPCYSDQVETTWSELGLEEEYTTVTKRTRRVFTFSKIQFAEALMANRPSLVFLNFCNQLPTHVNTNDFVKENIESVCMDVMGFIPIILLGFGAYSKDIAVYSSEGLNV